MTTERTGLLIIRAWTEAGSCKPLRAQIRVSSDVGAGFDRTLTVARAEEVVAVVQEWLAEIVQNAGIPTSEEPARDR